MNPFRSKSIRSFYMVNDIKSSSLEAHGGPSIENGSSQVLSLNMFFDLMMGGRWNIFFDELFCMYPEYYVG